MNKNEYFVNNHLGKINEDNIDKFIKYHKIDTGEFRDLHVGSTFNILYGGEEKTIMIAGFDFRYNNGTNKHHIVCIPISNGFYMKYTNEYNTHGPYAESYNHTKFIPLVNKELEKSFFDHLLSSTEILESKDGLAPFKCQAVLMSETEIYGKAIYGENDMSHQLPLFKIMEHFAPTHFNYVWLRNSYHDLKHFCYCGVHNEPYYSNAWDIQSVYPRFLIG